MGTERNLLSTALGAITGSAGLFAFLAVLDPTGISEIVLIGLYITAATAGGSAGSYINEFIDLLQESLKPTILLIGISGVGKTTLIKDLQNAGKKEKLKIRETKKFKNHTIYLTSKSFNIWDYTGSQPSQITSILSKLKKNTKIIPLFIVDICPDEEEFPVEEISKIPNAGELSIQDNIVKQRLDLQKQLLSDYVCELILGSIYKLNQFQTVGYFVNKIDLLDQESQEQIFELELPALKFLENISSKKKWNFILEKEAGSVLLGSKIQDLVEKITNNHD